MVNEMGANSMITTELTTDEERNVLLERGLALTDQFINKNYLIAMNQYPVLKVQDDMSRTAGLRLYI